MEYIQILSYFAIAIVIAMLAIVMFTYYSRKKKVFYRLNEDGYKHIFYGTGNFFIAFNISNGLFQCGNFFTNKINKYSVNVISSFNWHWVERNAVKISNEFVFYLSDIDNPSIKIFYSDKEYQAEKEYAQLLAVYDKCCISFIPDEDNKSKEADDYDLFISHASEDKGDFVRPLYNELTSLGLKVWYDEFSLKVGDSLTTNINKGLQNSKYGIVVLSNNFFAKQWTNYELEALTAKSISNEDKVILPIWHNVNKQQVAQYNYNLADKVAFDTASKSIEEIAKELFSLIRDG